MNKNITAQFFFFFAAMIVYPMVDDSVIPNSSYMIYEGQEEVLGGVPASSGQVTFYTNNGDPIKTVEHQFCFYAMERKLDQTAPKPQPVSYKIENRPITAMNSAKTEGASYIDLILFFDKNGNEIKRYYYDKINNQITIFWERGSERGASVYAFKSHKDLKTFKDFPLDLSVVYKKIYHVFKNSKHEKLLRRAIYSADLEKTEKILSKYPKLRTKKIHKDLLPIQLAYICKNDAIMRSLLDYGSNLSSKDYWKQYTAFCLVIDK